MSKRQPPIVRAGSGDSHEARLAVLEQRFSDDMKARCSWCNRVTSAKQGEWLEVVISTPGTGVRPAHVFRCIGCEAAPVAVAGGVLAVPSGNRRPGQSPPPLPDSPPASPFDKSSAPSAAGVKNRKSERSPQVRRESGNGRRKEGIELPREPQAERVQAPRRARKRPQAPVFPGSLSPAP